MQNFRAAVKGDGSEAQKRKMYNSRVNTRKGVVVNYAPSTIAG